MKVAAGAAALVLSCGLAATPARAQSCGSALEWHEAYENGRRLLNRGRPAVATRCFQLAIRKRPEPGTRLLIYGTNVLDEYYPYLLLARAQYLAGDLDTAEATLDGSASMGGEPEQERQSLAAEIAATRGREAVPQPTPPPTPAPTVAPTPAPTAEPTPATAEPGAEPGAEPTSAPVRAPTPVQTPEPPPPLTATARSTPATTSASAEPRPGSPGIAPPDPTRPEARTATLELRSDPPGVAVLVNGDPVGSTDAVTGTLRHELPPGRHELRMTRDGYAEAVTALELAPGERFRLRTGLVPIAASEGRRGQAIAIGLTFGLALLLIAWAWKRAFAQELPSGERDISGEETRVRAPARTPSGELPTRFGPYTLTARLGRGGMASVYRAEREGEHVALKRPQASFLEEPQFIERFLREAELGRALNHPNIVRIFDRGEVAGVPYFTMELLDGELLGTALRRRGRYEPIEAARVVVQVAEALDYAHSKQVVHRDLKPSNIWVRQDGRVKVMDFGIARARRFEGLTATGALLGTPEYISPEVVDGRSADARSDLYALGVVFYELVTGQRPFLGDSAFAIFKKHAVEAPTPPSALTPALPAQLERVILSLLAKKPEDRPGSAEALIVSLRDILKLR